jgi:uncharacterized protein YcbX
MSSHVMSSTTLSRASVDFLARVAAAQVPAKRLGALLRLRIDDAGSAIGYLLAAARTASRIRSISQNAHRHRRSTPIERKAMKLKTGTFFEIGAVYLLSSGSVGHLRELQGGTALIDRRRFRPNIYIDTGPATDRFVEDEWIGGTLEVGGTVLLDEFQPTLWCVTSTLAQEELPRDRSVLRTTAQYHSGCLGVYASVRHPGLVRVRHQVVLHGPGVAQPLSRFSGRAARRRRN